MRTTRVFLILALLLLGGCATLPENAGFNLHAKTEGGIEARWPWLDNALTGDIRALQVAEVAFVANPRNPDWTQTEDKDERRPYIDEKGGEHVLLRRVAVAYLYTDLGVRRFEAPKTKNWAQYTVIFPPDFGPSAVGKDLFLASSDESRVATRDGRVIWLAPNQKPWNLDPEFRRLADSKVKEFTTFRRGDANAEEFFKNLDTTYSKRALVDGTVYSVTADYTDLATLPPGKTRTDCLFTEGSVRLGPGALPTALMALKDAPKNIRAAKGNCYILAQPEKKEGE